MLYLSQIGNAGADKSVFYVVSAQNQLSLIGNIGDFI